MLLSVQEVLARTGLDRRALDDAVRNKAFPAPMPLGPWAFGWRREEVDAWIKERGGTAGEGCR